MTSNFMGPTGRGTRRRHSKRGRQEIPRLLPAVFQLSPLLRCRDIIVHQMGRF